MAEEHKRSRKQEDHLAEAYRGRRNVMSGAGWSAKADVRTHDFLIEAKTTRAGSFSLKLKDLMELRRQAIADDRVPLFIVDISGRSYVVLEDDDFREMVCDYDT